MRSVADRIRHAVCFELLGVLLVTLLSGWVFSTEASHFGPLALLLSLIATLWNYLYNLAYDHFLLRLRGRVQKTLWERVWHAFWFEFGMLVITLPLVMAWLDYTFQLALTMSLSLMGFYLLYTYVYNWAYDRLFPLPEWQQKETVE